MTQHASDILAKIDRIAAEVVAKHALEVDKNARFPRASVDALAADGLLGMVSAPEVGGLGQGPGVAVKAIERLAMECGSTAMVVCMHWCAAAVIEKHGDEATRRATASGASLSTRSRSSGTSRTAACTRVELGYVTGPVKEK